MTAGTADATVLRRTDFPRTVHNISQIIQKKSREHISEKMRAQRDAGKSYQEKGTTSAELPQSKYSLLK